MEVRNVLMQWNLTIKTTHGTAKMHSLCRGGLISNIELYIHASIRTDF